MTAIPFQPGLGKSTLIRALLYVFSEEFRDNTPIAQRISGVIVVVEKTAEADELEQHCNKHAIDRPIARAISSPNDYHLSKGKCPNGSATSYKECSGRSCAEYSICPLAQSTQQIHDTPILILLHARYHMYMEDMGRFMSWISPDGQTHSRSILLVDEIPPLIEDDGLDLALINELETAFANYKPSYMVQVGKEKAALLYAWSRTIRTPFFKLIGTLRKASDLYGLVYPKEIKKAGFTAEELQTLKKQITSYLGTENHPSFRLVDQLLSNQNAYYAVGQDISIFYPRLRRLNSASQPATFLFSGTAILSPELSRNPNIISLPDPKLESFERLHIHVQRGDSFNSSKTGMKRSPNRAALTAWLKYVLPEISQRHSKILVATYKEQSEAFWLALKEWHHLLIPFIDSDGQPQEQLPYFGGMNGSNQYLESTCVICLGLNRFEPRDYISRALALDFDRRFQAEIDTAQEVGEPVQLSRTPHVMAEQDLVLARDIVQLVFRSALRRHGETQPIELWLLQPPNGTVEHLRSYFGDCRIEEIPRLPESCAIAQVTGKTHMGNQTHAGRLLEYLQKWDGKQGITPAEIREVTGQPLLSSKRRNGTQLFKTIFQGALYQKALGKTPFIISASPDTRLGIFQQSYCRKEMYHAYHKYTKYQSRNHSTSTQGIGCRRLSNL